MISEKKNFQCETTETKSKTRVTLHRVKQIFPIPVSFFHAHLVACTINHVLFFLFFFRNGSFAPRGGHEYALKQIEGTGISMSACREIAVGFCHYSIRCFVSVIHHGLFWYKDDFL